MAREQEQIGGVLIHVSTDYVFDGRNNTPYTENDAPNPLSVYGQSKLAGEEGIQQKSSLKRLIRNFATLFSGQRGSMVLAAKVTLSKPC
jgi:dTDP-4-dehydrorhamnose reductase